MSILYKYIDFLGMGLYEMSDMFKEIPDNTEFIDVISRLTLAQKMVIMVKHLMCNDPKILSEYKVVMLCRLISKDSNNVSEEIIAHNKGSLDFSDEEII